MTWHFQMRGVNDLFVLTTVDVEPNDLHHFETDGRRVWYDESQGLVQRDNAMMITRGSLTIEVHNQEPVEYAFDNFPWDEETGQMGNTNPFPYPRQIYPAGDWMNLIGGPEGAEWVCFMPNNNRKISYECFRGNHRFRFQEDDLTGDRTGYMVVLKGHACMGGIGECEQYKIYEFPPRSDAYFEGEEDSIVFYVWERV